MIFLNLIDKLGIHRFNQTSSIASFFFSGQDEEYMQSPCSCSLCSHKVRGDPHNEQLHGRLDEEGKKE